MSLENPRAKLWRKRNSSSRIPKSEAVATCPTFRCRYRDRALLRPWMSMRVLVMQFFLATDCTTFTILLAGTLFLASLFIPAGI